MNYLRRHEEGLEVNQELGSVFISTSLKKYINSLCMNNLSTYEGRKLSIVKLLGETSNIPIYIDSKVILYSIKSIREYDVVFINYYKVLSFKKLDKKITKITFNNLTDITVNISFNRIKKQHIRIKKIITYLENRD